MAISAPSTGLEPLPGTSPASGSRTRPGRRPSVAYGKPRRAFGVSDRAMSGVLHSPARSHSKERSGVRTKARRAPPRVGGGPCPSAPNGALQRTRLRSPLSDGSLGPRCRDRRPRCLPSVSVRVTATVATLGGGGDASPSSRFPATEGSSLLHLVPSSVTPPSTPRQGPVVSSSHPRPRCPLADLPKGHRGATAGPVPVPGPEASRHLVHLPVLPRRPFHEDTYHTGPSGLPLQRPRFSRRRTLTGTRHRAPGHRRRGLSCQRSLTGRCSGLACARR